MSGRGRGKWTHGLSRENGKHTRLFRAWLDMRGRCDNPRLRSYASHGARGITYCSEWQAFERFVADMAPHPGEGWTLERIDNDGNYEPDNCKWATQTQQNRNQRRTKLDEDKVAEIRRLKAKGYSYGRMAAMYGVARSTIQGVVEYRTWRV